MISKFCIIKYFSNIKLVQQRCFSCSDITKVVDFIDFYSTLFNHDRKFQPLVIANVKNIDFEKVIKSSEHRKFPVNINIINTLISRYDESVAECLKLENEKNILMLQFNDSGNVSVEMAKDIRRQLKLLNKTKDHIMDELTLSILSLPNEMEHTPISDWNKCTLTDRDDRDLQNVIIKEEYIIEQVNKFFDGFKVAFDNSQLSYIKYSIMEHSYDWWIFHGFIPIALSDICKTASVEACNDGFFNSQVVLTNCKINNDAEDNINPHNMLFLKGSASLEAFCAYLMRTRSTKKCLPIKLVSLGNKYINDDNEVNQNSAITVLIATSCVSDMEVELRNLLNCLYRYWRDHFNLSLSEISESPLSLQKYECHRYVLRSCLGSENTMAYVSVIGDYLSRRLMIQDFNEEPLQLVYAEVCNFDVLCRSVKTNHTDIVFRYSSSWEDNKCV